MAFAIGVSSAATNAEPRWQVAPNFSHDSPRFAWAGGRFWSLSRPDSGWIGKSAPVRSGRLGSWVSAKARGTRDWAFVAVLGDDLVLNVPTPGGVFQEDSLRTIRLRADGTFGSPSAITGARTPESSVGSSLVRLPDRAVQLVAIPKPGRDFASDPGACCNIDGETVNYKSIPSLRNVSAFKLGLDNRGRLWLAWTPGGRKGQAGMVQLEPSTLLPRGAPASLPGRLSFWELQNDLVELVCTSVCRLVVSALLPGQGFGSFSWAPGERAATRLRPPVPGPGNTSVTAAGDDKGRLLVVYWYNDRSNVTWTALARGDARGSRLTRTSAIELPQRLRGFTGPELGSSLGLGVFGPGGFATVAVYGGLTMRVAILAS